MNDKIVIIPGCSDLNRGDQALTWETKRLAEDCGLKGNFYLTTEKNEPFSQSMEHGLNIITPILEHPSRVFSNKENIKYSGSLKIKWGIVALLDFLTSLCFFYKPTRKFIKRFINEDKKNSIEIMENATAFFMKGGGLLQSYGGLTSTYSMYFWVYHLLLAKAMKKPIYVLPNSFGPFKGPLVKTIARKALKDCTIVTARETLSQKMVQEQLNIDIDNYPDLAFYLPNAELDKNEIFTQYNLPFNRKLVALTMRPHRFPNSKTPEQDYELFKSEMAKFIEWLYEMGYMPVLIEHTLAINSHENDGACIKDVIARIASHKYRIVSNQNYNCYELKFVYSICDYVIGTRFHSVIFSLSNNVPGIAITYAGNKGQGIMHDIGLDEFTVAIKDVRYTILKEKFELLIENEEVVKNKIFQYLSFAKAQRDILVRKIMLTLE